MTEYSDYVIYVDESGDPNPNSLDENYPIFTLAFCIFEKGIYVKKISPMIQKLKFDFFGHDTVILHENELRRRQPPFNMLFPQKRYEFFMDTFVSILKNAPMRIIATTFDKRSLSKKVNLYNRALSDIIRQTQDFLRERKQESGLTHIIIEERGKKEDGELELEFRRICDENHFNNFDILFVSKKINSSGLQLADMVARPIGLSVLRPHQKNRAYTIIKTKFIKKRKTSEN